MLIRLVIGYDLHGQSIPKRNLWAPCVCGVESLYLFQIAKCGAIQILVRMLQTAKDNEEKLNACNAFWTLAFDEENQMEIKANEQAISELEKLLTDENISKKYSEMMRNTVSCCWCTMGMQWERKICRGKKAESWIATDNRYVCTMCMLSILQDCLVKVLHKSALYC